MSNNNLDASSLPPFNPTKEIVQCTNRSMTALEWAFSSCVPPMARIMFAQAGGASNDMLRTHTTPQMQWNYSLLHVANHYLSEQRVRKFMIANDENDAVILLEILSLRACPEDVKGVLPQSEFYDPMDKGNCLGALPIFFVRYFYENDINNRSKEASKFLQEMIMKVNAASVDEIEFARKQLQCGHSMSRAPKANESVLFPTKITKTKSPGKADYVCASCGGIITTRPAPSCSKCKVTYYCNRECQVTHWKSGGHKKICGKAGEGNVGSRKSIVFDIEDATPPAPYMTSIHNQTGNVNVQGMNKEQRSEMNKGTATKVSKLPTAKNVHGDREFIVKLQPPVTVGSSPWMCYDGPTRSFQAYIPANTPGLLGVYKLLQRDGVKSFNPMMPSVQGYKGYFKAKWEGSSIRVFYDQVVAPQMW